MVNLEDFVCSHFPKACYSFAEEESPQGFDHVLFDAPGLLADLALKATSEEDLKTAFIDKMERLLRICVPRRSVGECIAWWFKKTSSKRLLSSPLHTAVCCCPERHILRRGLPSCESSGRTVYSSQGEIFAMNYIRNHSFGGVVVIGGFFASAPLSLNCLRI